MRFSIFTPTHDLKHIPLVAESLAAQSFTDYEWVIGLNHGPTAGHQTFLHLPDEVRDRVKVVTIPGHEKYGDHVGYLKNYLCLKECSGEYLVELDHDDELTPDALDLISTAIDLSQVDSLTPAEFIYSDAVHIHDKDHTTQTYSSRYGWPVPKSVSWKGKDYPNQPAFEATAASLHDIFFSPDHVRVWRRDFYEQLGGHNSELSIADDHELLQRTYIAGGRMVHIPACLYIYHLHEDSSNTYLLRNREIQDQQARNGNKYRPALIHEWCNRESLLRIELGGGKTKAQTGVMGIGLGEADLIADIMRVGLPFKDNSVGHIHAKDFLEHIPHCRDSRCAHSPLELYGGCSTGDKIPCVVGLMNEIHRVLAPNGWFTSITPSTSGRGAFQDPTHCSFWNTNSFWYYTQQAQAKFLQDSNARFIQKRLWEDYPSDWCRKHEIPYVYAVLIALKEKNQPGNNGFWVPPG